MKPFAKLTAVAAPLAMANIDTDKIIPARYLRKPREPGYDPYLFYDLRYDSEGHERSDFVLNQPAYRKAGILIAGANFGCGSSREGAVYAMLDYGIRSVIAPSFGDIHYANQLQNGMLPVILPEGTCAALREQLGATPGARIAVDLESQRVTAPDGASHRFDIDPVYRERLLKGLDEVGLVLEYLPQIEAFEARHYEAMPWLAAK
ncbi:MAG TPA: 3-isopropylmalate dehydratase small subunit [Burkholderiales bacterium]|nr:3-isopropylmalate dehydratase small subunit [Burkholderiales bacterium]